MTSERTVELQGIQEGAVVSALRAEPETTGKEVANAVPTFTEFSCRAFKAQYAVVSSDLVIQFFLPEAVNPKTAGTTELRRWESYWLETFPPVLSQVAKEFFRADKPRLLAKYTEELASWWFRAQGFGDALDPSALAQEFCTRLSRQLEPQPGNN